MSEIVRIYNETKSIRQVCIETGFSISKVRKNLVQNKIFTSEICEKINGLYKKGISVDNISKTLRVSRSTVHNYLPYQKGEYKSMRPTKNALAIRKHREKRKFQTESCRTVENYEIIT